MSIRGAARSALQRTPAVQRVVAAAANPTRKGERLSAAVRAARYEANIRRGLPTRVPLGERSFILAYPGETNSPGAVISNPPNPSEMRAWRRFLRPGDLFIDVGANIGVYTIWAAECGAEVVAVEPTPHSAERIREHLTLNGYQAIVLEKALAETPGELWVTEDLDSHNHVTSDRKGRRVHATTLDEVVGDRTATVKIDVEGFEDQVLAGAQRALAEKRIRLMQVEWVVYDHMTGSDRGGMARILSEVGYELLVADNEGKLHKVEVVPPNTANVFAAPRR